MLLSSQAETQTWGWEKQVCKEPNLNKSGSKAQKEIAQPKPQLQPSSHTAPWKAWKERKATLGPVGCPPHVRGANARAANAACPSKLPALTFWNKVSIKRSVFHSQHEIDNLLKLLTEICLFLRCHKGVNSVWDASPAWWDGCSASRLL